VRGFRDSGLPLDEGLTGIEMATLLAPTLPEIRLLVATAREALVRLNANRLIEELDAALERAGAVPTREPAGSADASAV